MRTLAASLLPAACLLLAAEDAAARPCVVEGKSVEPLHLDVVAKGGPTLHLRVAGVPATARIADPGEGNPPAPPIAVDVKGAIAFSGTLPPERLPLAPRAKVDTSNGMLRLQPGAGQLIGRARSRFVEGDLLLEGARFHGVLLPCDSLTIDPVEAPAHAAEPPRSEPFVPKTNTIKLYGNPGSGPVMEVELKHSGDLELHRSEKSGPWWKVTTRFRDGSLLVAWVKGDELTKPQHAELQDMPIVPPPCSRAPEAKGAKLAEAELVAGSAVSADRLFQWASARGGDKVTIRWSPGERWVELVQVPGITTNVESCEGSTVLDDAWAPRTAVKMGGENPDAGAK
jgi:hypothetical protein